MNCNRLSDGFTSLILKFKIFRNVSLRLCHRLELTRIVHPVPAKRHRFFLIAPTFESLLSISTPFVDSSLSDDDETRSLNR